MIKIAPKLLMGEYRQDLNCQRQPATGFNLTKQSLNHNINNSMEIFRTFSREMRGCTLCSTEGFSIIPGAIFSGNEMAKIMIIGQAPGETEVSAGRPFNATSGRRLFQWLEEAGWEETDFRNNQYITSVTKCYPGKNKSGHGDRVPSMKEQELCQPFLIRELKRVQPQLVIPVGRLAISKFLPGFRALSDVVGKCAYIPWDQINQGLPVTSGKRYLVDKFENPDAIDGLWAVPLPHPSGASLWPNQSTNKELIQHALMTIGAIREEYGL
jgi:uracil-DNA glycosylase family 4